MYAAYHMQSLIKHLTSEKVRRKKTGKVARWTSTVLRLIYNEKSHNRKLRACCGFKGLYIVKLPFSI